MFLKKDGVTQNHKIMFIAMFLIVIVFAVLIVIRDNNKKVEIYENNKALIDDQVQQSEDRIDRLTESLIEEAKNNKTSNIIKSLSLDGIPEENMDKKKLLFFFASWNKESVIMLEEIKKISKSDNNKTKFVVIEVEGSNADSKFFEDRSLVRIQCDDATIPAKYLVEAVPTIVVLEKDNKVLTTTKGSMNSEEIQKLIY